MTVPKMIQNKAKTSLIFNWAKWASHFILKSKHKTGFSVHQMWILPLQHYHMRHQLLPCLSLASCQHIKTEGTICSVHWTRRTEIRRGGGGERNPREEIKKRQTVQYKPDHGCLANMGQLLWKKNVEHPKLCKFL